MGCIAIQLLCPRHGQAERTGELGAGSTGAGHRLVLGPGSAAGAQA